ncbi:MAG: hypothetical protein PHI85_08895 [Victivallaceae bacterium]|nr:hypothetical protein [Victivallaceae bacterium]
MEKNHENDYKIFDNLALDGEPPGGAVELAGLLIQEFRPDVEIAVKK